MPASSIFCLPILPQRGCTVASSLIRGPAVEHVPRADLVLEFGGIVRMGGILHRVQVVQVAEELIEAVDRRQELVQVAQMILAELSGGVAHASQRRGDRRRLRRHAERGTGLSDRGQPGADGESGR